MAAAAPDGYPQALKVVAISGAERRAAGARHVALGPPGCDQQLTLLGPPDDDAPLALWLPLDADLPVRLEAAAGLWRRLHDRSARPSGSLSAQRGARLLASLRAVDARAAGASTREIAAALFGAERLPTGRDWRDNDLRSRTKRLIGAGLAMVRGGYRSLLRANRRS